MFELLKKMKRKEWLTAGLCAILVLGQIYFDLRLPDYMSDLTVLIKTPGSAMSDIWQTGLEMLGCTLASALLAIIADTWQRRLPQASAIQSVKRCLIRWRISVSMKCSSFLFRA